MSGGSLNTERAKDKARKYEHRRQYDKAIEVYSRIINSLEGKTELVDDLALFNKLGDLYLRVGDVGSAVESYERAADHYSDQGLANNAIALCNKILRSAPGRTSIYLKLAKLLMQRGFTAEVKRNLVEYWDRMARADEGAAAFETLEDFVDLYSTRPEVYVIVAELFMKDGRIDEARALLAKLYDDVVREGSDQEQRSIIEEIQAIDPTFSVEPEADDGAAPSDDADIVFISPDDPEDLDIALASVELESGHTGSSGLEVETTKTAEMPSIVLPDDIEDIDDIDDADEADDRPTLAVVEDDTENRGTDLADDRPTLAVVEDDTENRGADLADDQPTLAVVDEETVNRGADVAARVDAVKDDSGDAAEFDPWADDEPDLVAERDVPPHIRHLESRVAESPDVLEIHRELAEALLEYGDRERGLEELDIVLMGCEELEDWHKAQAVVEEILRIDPNSVKHHRRRISYVERNGFALEPGSFERGRWVSELVRASLDLGDALVREGTIDEAQAVYRRVLKYQTGNARAETALQALGLDANPNGPTGVATAGPAPALASRPDQSPGSSGVAPSIDVSEDSRSGFDDVPRGIDARLSEEDSQAHYDLGVAFKEMGLLDEAISEFQKALGGEDGSHKAAEALGLCFFEKGQFSVAATILKRAAEAAPSDDTTKVGLLYWLARCHEEQGDAVTARRLYERVSVIDDKFQDIERRVRDLPAAGS